MRFLTIGLLLISQTLICQNIQIFDTTNSAISSNDLWSLAVDSTGSKWVGTAKSGLVKYNGLDFVVFDENNSEIKGNCISPAFIDTKGALWVSFWNPDKLENGLAKFDGVSWTNYSSKEIKMSTISIIAIEEDIYGNIYFGGENELTKFDGTNWTKIELPKGQYTIRALAIDSKGTLAIGHNNGLLIRKNDKWKSYTESKSKLQSYVRSLKFNKKGDLFIGYGGNAEGGLSILDIKGKWQHFNKNNSNMPDNMVRDIEFDKEGNVWMATNNGLVKFSHGIITPYYFRKGQYQNVLMDIAIQDNTIWIASTFGLIKFDE